jgi:23S rRNA G2069 N7-methylase RlmK/C1962 C5-methylase RlmI
VFEGKPKLPPSFAQVKQSEEVENIWKSTVDILSKTSFVLTSISYGLTCSTYVIFSTFLNQLISRNFKVQHLQEEQWL